MTRRYPAYKITGIDWLPEVPSHWDTQRLKNLFDLQKRPVNDDDGIVTAFRDGTVTLRANRREDGFTNAILEIGYQGVRKGDLIIHAMDGFAGAIGVSDSDGKSTPVYSVCKPKDAASSRFYGRLLRHMALTGFVSALSKGVRERSTEFRWADASVLPLPVPPLPEQTAIAAFLDRETAKIDALVEEQKRLIELLKEKRQAVITQAVTKGLNPNVPMKPSGVEWLGDVPAHWKSGRAARFIGVTSGFAFPSIGFSNDDSCVKLLRGINVGVGELRWDEVVFWERSEHDGLDSFELRESALIIGMDRPFIEAGLRVARVNKSDLPCLLLQRVAEIKTNDQLNLDFFQLLLESEGFYHFVAPEMTGVSVPHISPSQICDFPISVPPLEEQNQIVAKLKAEKVSTEALIAYSQKAIGLLVERRSALISAAVTGKIDVRGFTAEQEAA